MSSLDPLGVNVRLYNQISEILHHLETDERVTLKERIAALIAIGRIQIMFMGMRKEKIHDASAGSSVRKYSKAFKAHDARGRKAIAGRAEAERTADDDIIRDAINDAWGDDGDTERDTA
jgi:hypothetical protein